MNATAQTQTVFDHDHYLRLIEARGETIRKSMAILKPVFGLSTALDAGCGLGFFAQILNESGLDVRAFDGRAENVQEGRRRFPNVRFECGDIQDPGIRQLGQFDFVLCFGLLYHLESPLAAIRNLHALTRKALLLESMCLPEETPWMLLREEPRLEDQSLTDVAFYASEGCLAKMLYRASFSFVYRVDALPEHDDFKDTPDYLRRRTILLATSEEVTLPGFTHFPEPRELADPWLRQAGRIGRIRRRASSFSKKPAQQKYLAVIRRVRRYLPFLPVLLRLPFGVWWVAQRGALDHELTSGNFEGAELKFAQRFLKPGMTVLDVGAHHGLYTLLASKSVGSTGTVIAIEPSPRERKRLIKNLKINRMKNVAIQKCALGAKSGEAKLYLTDSLNNWCNSLRQPTNTVEAVNVPVRPLDELISELKLTRIDFIKLDIEGGELDALAGAQQMLRLPGRPVILIEVQDIRTAPWGHKGVDVIRFLQDLNYVWMTITPDGSLQRMNTEADKYDGNFAAIPSERSDEVLRDFQPRTKL